MSPWSLLFSRLTSPRSLSLSLYGKCSSCLIIFCPLDLLQQLYALVVLGASELDTILQVVSHESWVEGQNLLPRGSSSLWIIICKDLCWTLSREFLSFLSWGVQNWTQYSRCSFTRAEQSGNVTSLDLLIMLFFVHTEYTYINSDHLF